ncbi:MAG TPA: FAD-dependent thymidylate synthase [Chitinophagaceae bacterium]|nr:FAD-dependent thymidylate synthase [Chitinophagaceae bacterium]
MNVKLVSLTKSLVEEKELSPEELIVYVARVSNPSNQLNAETSDKLIAYLVKNKHWSPFEMVDMTVEIVTSRGIAQQILRHRSFSFQEFSQRYAKVNDIEPVQLRYQADKNRQSSTDALNEDDSEYFEEKVKQVIDLSQQVYGEMIDKGVAKECARFVLPITTQTKIYMKGSIRSWIHYLQIRCDAHTQLEHRQIALLICDIFKNNFPNISKALEL